MPISQADFSRTVDEKGLITYKCPLRIALNLCDSDTTYNGFSAYFILFDHSRVSDSALLGDFKEMIVKLSGGLLLMVYHREITAAYVDCGTVLILIRCDGNPSPIACCKLDVTAASPLEVQMSMEGVEYPYRRRGFGKALFPLAEIGVRMMYESNPFTYMFYEPRDVVLKACVDAGSKEWMFAMVKKAGFTVDKDDAELFRRVFAL